MAGAKAGVATKIQELEPRAVFLHCYRHALNLAVSDTIKQSRPIKDCLDTCYQIIKLIKFSPKREAMLRDVKEETGNDASGVRTLCPTRWTVRAESLASIIANYESIQSLWEVTIPATSDTKIKARICGVASQMQTFKFLFGISLSELILRHTDKLSQTLQMPKLSSVEGQGIAMLTVRTLKSMRAAENFKLFWQKVEKMRFQQELGVDEPQLPRRRKGPRRFEEDSATSEFPLSVDDEYRHVYFEVIDLSVMSIRNRFDQKGFQTFSNMEQLLYKACTGHVSKKNYIQCVLSFLMTFIRLNWSLSYVLFINSILQLKLTKCHQLIALKLHC